jgi:hypothetical protein
MAAVSLNLPFTPVVVTTKPLQNIRETLYRHIKKVDLCVPELMGYLLGKDLKDLTEESNSNSRSISRVKVGFKIVIRIERSREVQGDTYTAQGDQISLDREDTQDLGRDRFLLSLKTDPEIKAAIIEGKRAESQKSLESNQPLSFAQDTVDYVMTGGHSPFYLSSFDQIIDFHLQDIKSARDRVKDLECLFKNSIESLAKMSKGFDIGTLNTNNPVKIELKEMRFSVGVDDGSITEETQLTFPINS